MLGRKTAVERGASCRLRAARRNEDRGEPASPLTLAMTRNEIADHLGLTLETVSRGFSRLRQLGVIRLDGADRVTLTDLDRLAELAGGDRSEEHTSELQSLMRISYAVFCLKKKNKSKMTKNKRCRS